MYFVATRILLNLILINLHSVPSCIRCHLYFKRSDQGVFFSVDRFGIILMFPVNVVVFKLESSRDLSIALLNLTRTGRSLFEYSLYLPSCRWYRIDRRLMLLSVLVLMR